HYIYTLSLHDALPISIVGYASIWDVEFSSTVIAEHGGVSVLSNKKEERSCYTGRYLILAYIVVEMPDVHIECTFYCTFYVRHNIDRKSTRLNSSHVSI